jgi:5,10-methylenetetrahydromethanopterin reductase
MVGAAYEEARHGASSAPAAARLEDDFIDRFAVVGPAAEVADRLRSLAELGLDRLIVVPGSLDADPALLERSNEAFASQVLPLLLAG